MNTDYYCSNCGTKLSSKQAFCSACGNKVSHDDPSSKSIKKALLLCIFLGFLGAHRFYVRRFYTAILMLLTLGGLGIWIVVDLVFIIFGEFKDNTGNKLKFAKQPSGLKRTAILFGSLITSFIAYVLLVVCLAIYATSGLVSVVRSQLTALRNDNIEKAYTYTSKDFQNAVPLAKFKAFVNTYPSLKNNERISFNDREYKNGEGFLDGKLISADGAVTPIKYHLVKENGSWKILSMTLNPTGIVTNESVKQNNGISIFKNKSARYSIQYPSNWKYKEISKGTVVFSNKNNTRSSFSSVNIQAILTTKSGGHYSNVDEFFNNMKGQISKLSNYNIITKGDAELPTNVKDYKGKYIVFTYKHKDKDIKQMQFIFMRTDSLLIYSWGYTATADVYDTYLPDAKAMFESWVIY